jgi:hypothetical protein
LAGTYISNGAFIAAAVGSGLRFHVKTNCPNPTFNLGGQLVLRRLRTEEREGKTTMEPGANFMTSTRSNPEPNSDTPEPLEQRCGRSVTVLCPACHRLICTYTVYYANYRPELEEPRLCPECLSRYSPSLLKALMDPFEYALKLRSGEIFFLVRPRFMASLSRSSWMANPAPWEDIPAAT